MSEEDVKFLSREQALEIVAAIQEEEDIYENNRRILTVYNHDDKEVCWFDFDEVMEAVGKISNKADKVEAVQEYIITHLPDWALDI